MFRVSLVALPLIAASAAFALPVPQEEKDGVFLRIEGFDPLPKKNDNVWDRSNLGAVERGTTEPFRFEVTLENRSQKPRSGQLAVWMNDDWRVEGKKTETVTLAAGEKRVFMRTAQAGARVLPAVYPLHASFSSGDLYLHPIAIFRAKTENRAFAPSPEPERTVRPAVTDDELSARAEAARRKAKEALAKGTDAADGRYVLTAGKVRYGAGVVRGGLGLVDGAIAFTDGERVLTVRGFACEVDGIPACEHAVADRIASDVSAEAGTLRVRWSMPGVTRRKDGSPRFTRLAAGPTGCRLLRSYAGTGLVLENPGKFSYNADGSCCSTRHVGADYENGLSLVQASDLVADRLTHDPGQGLFALEVHDDATLSFTPSNRGAFDAALRFSKVSGYRKSPGFDNLSTKIVLDDWYGDYLNAAAWMPLHRRYGLDAVYICHFWQRWGYDVRLPEIWPPKGDRAAFDAMVRSARDAGFVFGLHDNYADIYPDLPDFSYDQVAFGAEGLPTEAWYNPYARLLSYSWNPDRIWPWHGKNMKLTASGAGVGALFIDVFTAAPILDYFDRDGTFHPKRERAAAWGASFDRARDRFGKPDAITISEAGSDALVGHIDAGAADHYSHRRIMSGVTCDDSERIPWHDALTHGKMVLLGGGIGARYAETDVGLPGADALKRGYGTHDYFCVTAIGGRGAFCESPFSRGAVTTWWLLGDVLRELAKGTFDSFRFGRDIHEQCSVFSTGVVCVNRATNRCWTVHGEELPPYGLLAKAGPHRAGIVRRNGYDVRYAKSPRRWYVDARPPPGSATAAESASVIPLGFAPEGARQGTLKMDWNVKLPRFAIGKTVFVHVIRHDAPDDAEILAQPGVDFADGQDAYRTAGRHRASIALALPDNLAAGEYDIRLGVYDPSSGVRDPLGGLQDGAKRLCLGTVTLAADGRLSWRPAGETRRTRELGLNMKREMIDFGGVVTDGAFRIEVRGGALVVTPLPESWPFRARIDPKAFGLKGEPFDFSCDATEFEYTVFGK